MKVSVVCWLLPSTNYVNYTEYITAHGRWIIKNAEMALGCFDTVSWHLPEMT
jgi:hypothetical protein